MLSRKIRNEFCDKSTGKGNVYETKGHAVYAFESVLIHYELHFDSNDFMDLRNDEGRMAIYIINNENKCVGCAVITWYRYPSGRYEFIGYIA